MTHEQPAWYRNWIGRSERLHEDLDIFFVVGCQKSGTTWIEKLLNQHPRIACRGEAHFCSTMIPVLQQALNFYTNAQLESGRMPKEFQPRRDDLLGMSRLMIDQMLMRYVSAAPEPDRIAAVGDKTPEHANSIPLLHEMYPNARFIHIIRDGRDACVSGWAHLNRKNKAGEFKTFAEYAGYFAERHWMPYILHARQASNILGDHYLELTYETLRTDPMPHTTTLFRFLDVDHDDATVSNAIDGASFEKMSGGRQPGQEDASSHMRKGIVGDWKNHFDDEALARFNQHGGALLESLGYETCSTVPA